MEIPIALYTYDDMITTKDNPYNPHTDWAKWDMWDRDMGYNTTTLLGRLSNVPVDSDDYIMLLSYSLALEEMIELDDENIYKIVKKND